MGSGDLHKIAVLNPKGGSGKTTLAVTLAAALAQQGHRPTLVDCDSQGFAMRWVEKRPADRPPVYALQGFGEAASAAPLQQQVEADSRVAILDLPAAIPYEDLHDLAFIADSVIIPVVPSEIDIHSASRLIAELLLDAQIDRRIGKLAIVANRVRTTTRSFRKLQRFLSSLRIPMIASLRDTQNFVHATSTGLGITELPRYLVANDAACVESILAWLARSGMGLNELPDDGEQVAASDEFEVPVTQAVRQEAGPIQVSGAIRVSRD